MYLALYRKWRPKTFQDVIGQPAITVTLKQEVTTEKTAHAYLFTGPRGTGKTTCSKILSMAINCTNPQDGDPCMECESCKGIDQGSILDVVEIDAASNNGVDNIRQLRDEANFTPTQCKYRVYIIDEAHMLSIGAFNALLKIMEEPPAHVVFILATTEAHKVPATILSRCQRFDFKQIKSEDISERLSHIATNEGVILTDEASMIIARLAKGGMRDALSLLDQCIAYSNEITAEILQQAVGIVGQDYLYKMTSYIAQKNPTEALLLIEELCSKSKDLQSLLEELTFHFRNIMLVKTMDDPTQLVEVLPHELEQLKNYKLPLSTLLYAIGEMQDCLDKMGRSIDRRLSIELCIIKLCSPVETVENTSLVARLDALEVAIKSGMKVVNPYIGNTPQVERITQADETPETTQLMEWVDILDIIKKGNEPLWGTLVGTTASIGGGFLYIENAISFASDMLRKDSNAKKLVDAVEQVTNIRYKLRLAKVNSPTAQNEANNLLSKAKELGVEINQHD